MQCYKLNKFSEDPDRLYEDWYAVEGELKANRLNREYTGPQLERKYNAVYTKIQEDENE